MSQKLSEMQASSTSLLKQQAKRIRELHAALNEIPHAKRCESCWLSCRVGWNAHLLPWLAPCQIIGGSVHHLCALSWLFHPLFQ